MLTLIPLPAFEDNYIWIWHDDHHAVAVDPGDPVPLIAYLDARHLALTAILITHHHRDHTGGNVLLRQRYNCPVYAPDNPRIPAVTHVLHGGDSVDIAKPFLHFDVLPPRATRSTTSAMSATTACFAATPCSDADAGNCSKAAPRSWLPASMPF